MLRKHTTNPTFAGLPVVGEIFRPIEARYKEIQSVAGYAGSQIGGLSAAKGWSASRGLHQGTS